MHQYHGAKTFLYLLDSGKVLHERKSCMLVFSSLLYSTLLFSFSFFSFGFVSLVSHDKRQWSLEEIWLTFFKL